jgi:hypothetical protein
MTGLAIELLAETRGRSLLLVTRGRRVSGRHGMFDVSSNWRTRILVGGIATMFLGWLWMSPWILDFERLIA